jgi:transcriptional regulator
MKTQQQKKLLTKKYLTELRNQGLTFQEIGEKLNMPASNVYYYFRKVKPRKSNKIIKLYEHKNKVERKEKIKKTLKQRHSQQRIGKPATKEVLQKLREKGLTYSEIAMKLKMPSNNIYYYMNKYDLIHHREHVENNNHVQ